MITRLRGICNWGRRRFMWSLGVGLALLFLISLALSGMLPPSAQMFDGQPSRPLAAAPVAPAAPGTARTRVFRQGLDGYTGVRDTWVSTHNWDTPPQHTVNYGQNASLVLTRDGRDNPLLRFDLASIPPNSAVLSATVALYNTEPSSWSGTHDFLRRVRLFRVLRDWDEGNQVASPIDAPGKHGATGDNAFDYYGGEGTDIAWGAPESASKVGTSQRRAMSRRSKSPAPAAGRLPWASACPETGVRSRRRRASR